MESSDFFLALGEIAVTLAGFASVVVVFKRRDGGVWEPADFVRFRGMLGMSLSAAFFSVLPVGLYHAGLSEPTTWTVSNLALGGYAIVVMVALLRGMKSLRQSSFSRSLALAMQVSQAIAVVLLLLNAFAILLPGGPAAYIYAVVLLLAMSGVSFMRLVVLPGEG